MHERKRLSPFGKGLPVAVMKPLGQLGVHRTLNGSNLFTSGSQSLFSLSYNLGGREEVTRPYEENPWVHAALKVLAEAVSSVRLRLWMSDAPDAKELPEGHELAMLFDQPNPFMSRPAFFAAGLIHRKLCGEDFWFLRNRQGLPVERSGVFIETPAIVQCVRGNLVEPKKLDNGELGWKYDGANGQEVLFPPWAVIHFRDYDPYNPTRGLGDVESLARILTLQFQAERYQEGLMRNAGDPGGFIKYKGTLPPGERGRLEEEINADFSNPANAGEWKVIDEDAEYLPNKLGPRDMEYTEGLRWWRDLVLAVLGVPPPLVGIYDDASYNNIREAQRMLWTGGNGVIAYLRSVEDTLDSYFFSKLRDSGYRSIRARFDLTSIEALREDNTEKIAKAAGLVKEGVGLSLHESFDLVGVDVGDLPMGDTHYTTPSLQIVNADKQGDESAHLSVEQVVAVSTIVAQVAAGTLPRDSAFGMLTALLGLSQEQAEIALGTAGTGAATQPNKPEGAEEGEPNALTGEDEDEDEDEDEGDEDGEGPSQQDERALKSPRELSILRSSSRDSWREEYLRFIRRRVRAPSEKDIAKAARRYLKVYRAAQLKRIEDFARNGTRAKGFDEYTVEKALTPEKIVNALLLDPREWNKKMVKALGRSLYNTYMRSLKAAAEELGRSGIGILSVSDPRIVAAMSQQSLQLAEGVNSTLAKQLRKAMLEVLTEPDTTMTNMRAAVESKLRELKAGTTSAFPDIQTRARVIAHTEAAHGSSMAKYLAYKEEGIEEIEWVSQKDANVRESHQHVDGTVVNIQRGERFSNGLLFPSEPGAPAGEVIECRCDFAPADF